MSVWPNKAHMNLAGRPSRVVIEVHPGCLLPATFRDLQVLFHEHPAAFINLARHWKDPLVSKVWVLTH